MKRVAVFIDGSNYFYTAKSLGWTIDFEKFREYCSEYGNIVEAIYYLGTSGTSQKKYLNRLAYLGYSLVTKPLKSIHDPAGKLVIQKANLDVEIVLDMINMIDRYDVAILVSGDGDFGRAVQLLKSRGKEVKVVSTKGRAAWELVQIAGINYIDLLSIKERIELKEGRDKYGVSKSWLE